MWMFKQNRYKFPMCIVMYVSCHAGVLLITSHELW